MYKSENAFSKVLSLKLKLLGYSVTRIETGLTCQGVPDMFVQGNGTDFWLELKNEKKLTLETTKLKVQWRPGQQPWAYADGLGEALGEDGGPRCHQFGWRWFQRTGRRWCGTEFAVRWQ